MLIFASFSYNSSCSNEPLNIVWIVFFRRYNNSLTVVVGLGYIDVYITIFFQLLIVLFILHFSILLKQNFIDRKQWSIGKRSHTHTLNVCNEENVCSK